MENELVELPRLSLELRDRFIEIGMRINEDANYLPLPNSPHIIFEDGRLYSLKYNLFLIPHKPSSGYLKYTLGRKGKRGNERVHCLVGEVFVPNPHGFKVLNHIDGDKMNNFPSNLEWTTAEDNLRHAHKQGLIKNKNSTNISKALLQYSMDGEFIAEYSSSHDASRATGVSHGTIARCAKGGYYHKKKSGEKVWWKCTTAGGFLWEFKDPTNRVRHFFTESEVRLIVSMVCDQFDAPIEGRDDFIAKTIDLFISNKNLNKSNSTQ